MERHLGGPPTREPGQHLSTGPVPPRQLLRRNGVGGASGVEAADERRRARRAAPDVEGPAHECAVLVRVQHDGRGGLQSDAVLESLNNGSALLRRALR